MPVLLTLLLHYESPPFLEEIAPLRLHAYKGEATSFWSGELVSNDIEVSNLMINCYCPGEVNHSRVKKGKHGSSVRAHFGW